MNCSMANSLHWPTRILHLLINLLAFSLIYPLANLLAQQSHVERSVVLLLDHAIPFVPWMIVPYMSSGLLLALSFLWVRSKDDVRVLSQRLLLATVVAAMVFVLYPVRFSMQRPAVDASLPSFLFGLLSAVDRPYNQMPSLHVTYCVILWASLRTSVMRYVMRMVLAVWLMLVAIATVFTYQHHLLDVVGGLLLGTVAVYAIRPGRKAPNVAFYYLMSAGIVLLVGVSYLKSWFGLYLAMSLALVALTYARGDRFFLHKREGRFAWWVWLLYGPYLFGYVLTWLAVRFRERHKPPFVQVNDSLWIGRRLTNHEAKQLPADCVVFDLANELSETPALRSHPYRHFPLLDLVSPDVAVVDAIVDAMLYETDAGRPIYLHCAMGYSRSTFLAKRFTEKLAT